MLDAYCPHHRCRVLVGPRSIEALVDTPDGVVLHWRCFCGTRSTTTLGRERAAGMLGPPVAPAA